MRITDCSKEVQDQSTTSCTSPNYYESVNEGMEKCAKCHVEVVKTYSCDHTWELKFCTVCYQQLHWDLTNDV